jgi:L-serine dehydratase
MVFEAYCKSSQEELLLTETYYSLGGGFIEEDIEQRKIGKIHSLENELSKNVINHLPNRTSQKNIRDTTNKTDTTPIINTKNNDILNDSTHQNIPFHFTNTQELFSLSQQNRYHPLSLAEIALANEKAIKNNEIEQILHIWHVMQSCIVRGINTTGTLPGGLNVTRRANQLAKKLYTQDIPLVTQQTIDFSSFFSWIATIKSDFQNINQLISCVALAVNEENASFGRVVTAPTNGSAGVIPAVLTYLLYAVPPEKKKYQTNEENVIEFLATAGIIGTVFRQNATISAAMGGCQAEIGVSSAMAAAGLTACLKGSVCQVMAAAEIAMEHHLGMTCDPIKGLVQVPCIERNSMGAIKAINATYLALESNPDQAKVTLDEVIHTMWVTAQDMPVKYKETSLGGLAIHVREVNC